MAGFSAKSQVVDGAVGYYNDALIFSQTSSTYGSTARMQGFGGTQTSLGADMSSAGSNPAGLGFFNRSVFSFTPSINLHTADATYLGSTISTYKNNFNFANMGVVFNTNKGDFTSEKFKGGSFAISLNRTNDFNDEITYQGRNGNNSIIDSFLAEAGSTSTNNLSGYALSAYENYLINPVYDDEENVIGYDSFVLGFPQQSETITRSGSQYDLNFSWGGNYNDMVYFGAGLGFVTLNYSTRKIYTEEQFLYEDDEGNTQVDDWISYTKIRDDLAINGSGVKGSLGLIVRPINILTLGVSYNTPTYYSLDEESEFRHDTQWNDVELDDGTILNDRNFTSDLFISQYNLKSPGKLSAGASVFLNKLGFISADVELVDYRRSQLKTSDFNVTADNQTIDGLYGRTINYRAGAEFRLDKLRLRAGYAYFGDPYKGTENFDRSGQNITGGVGFRSQDFFIDLAVVNRRQKEVFAPYYVEQNQPEADVLSKSTTISTTIGFNF